MSFADELRNTKVTTKEDKWREFCQMAASDLKNRIQNTCRIAARNGEDSARVLGVYNTYLYKDVDFPRTSGSGLFGIFESREITIMKEEIVPIIREECEKLGLKYCGIEARYYSNGDAPSDFRISIRVKW